MSIHRDRRLLSVATIVVVFALLSTLSDRASAALTTLTSGNSVVEIESGAPGDDPADQGMLLWEVDGVSHLFQQWFWFRTGGVGGEIVLGELAPQTVTPVGTNQLILSYGDAADGFSITVIYTLTGGTPGSLSSAIGEQIVIENLSANPLDIHFFQYTDFDLGGDAGDDSARFVAANEVEQQDGGGSTLSEAIVTPAASHRQIDTFPAIFVDLTDALPTTLSDTPAIGVPFGPTDVTWAFQWDFVILPQGVQTISKIKSIQGVVPEPASIALWSLGAIGLIGIRSRKRRG
jgi:hypothetical protein